MKTASRRIQEADEGSFLTDLARGILLLVVWVVRAPLLLIFAFLEPFVRLVLMGTALLGVLTAFVYRASGVAPHFPFWQMIGLSLGCVFLLAGYHSVLRLLSR